MLKIIWKGKRTASFVTSVDGYIYAMAGASDRHNRACLNVAYRLNEHLVDNPCEVFMSDMKLKVAPNVYYYPDVAVCCDSRRLIRTFALSRSS